MQLSLTTIDIVMMAAGAIFLVIWLGLYLNGLKHNAMFEVLDEGDYPLKEIYGLGYGVLELIRYDFKKKGDRKLRQQLDILYGEKYCEYYLRVIRAQQVTFLVTVFTLAFAMHGLTQEPAAVAIVMLFAFVAFYYYGTSAEKRIQERSDALLKDFSEVVSKLALLTNAGMIMREAWQEVAEGGEGVIYDEMRLVVVDMSNGVSEIDAFYNFGMRCVIPEIKKFTSTIIQGMTKGNSELVIMLQEQSKEVWQLKQTLVRREGEQAATKLLFPMMIMFVGILIMIVVPIFTNLGVG